MSKYSNVSASKRSQYLKNQLCYFHFQHYIFSGNSGTTQGSKTGRDNTKTTIVVTVVLLFILSVVIVVVIIIWKKRE